MSRFVRFFLNFKQRNDNNISDINTRTKASRTTQINKNENEHNIVDRHYRLKKI